MEESRSEQVGGWIAAIGVMIPSLMVAGFMPDWNVLPPWGWIAIAAVSAAVGMAVSNQSRVAAGLGGLAGGACIPVAVLAYVHFRAALSDTFFNVEFLLPAAIGALPGLGVYALVKKLLPDTEQDEQHADL